MSCQLQNRIHFRPVEASDDEFLLRVFEQNCEPVRALAEPFRSQMVQFQLDAQRQQYSSTFPSANDYIIEFDENSIGRILISKDDEKIHIVDISILPKWQCQGAGRSVVSQVVAGACEEQLPTELSVLKQSRAVGFYQRLGFHVIGESDFYFAMRHEATII